MSLSLYILSLGTSINVKHPRWPPLPRLVLPLPPGIHPEGNSLWHTQPPASAIAVLVAPKLGGKKRQTWLQKATSLCSQSVALDLDVSLLQCEFPQFVIYP